jgi:hypothetical protein
LGIGETKRIDKYYKRMGMVIFCNSSLMIIWVKMVKRGFDKKVLIVEKRGKTGSYQRLKKQIGFV